MKMIENSFYDLSQLFADNMVALEEIRDHRVDDIVDLDHQVSIQSFSKRNLSPAFSRSPITFIIDSSKEMISSIDFLRLVVHLLLPHSPAH